MALPFALLTNALSGKSLGSYMGLFNCTICLPQIVASLVGGVLFMTFGGKDVYLEVPVAGEAKVEVVAEDEATEAVAEAVEEVVVVEQTTEATEVVAEATEVVEPTEEVIAEEQTAQECEVVAEAEVKTELKKFQSGQIVMLVIAGISLILGALAVFGINTRKKE